MSAIATETIYSNPKNPNDVVASRLTHAKAAELCGKRPTGNTLAHDLSRRVYSNRSLSMAQVFWLHKIAHEQLAAEEKHKNPIGSDARVYCNLMALVEFMEPASKSLKSGACLTFADPMPESGIPNNGTVQIKRARGESRWKGQYFVTDGGKSPEAHIYGRILANGDFVPHRFTDEMPPVGVLAMLDELANDIRGFIQSYGVRTGRCCFCHIKLEDPVSYKLGYGPVCAGHYQMPHGKEAVAAVERGKPLSEVRAKSKDKKKLTFEASELAHSPDHSQWWGQGGWPVGFAHKGIWYVQTETVRDDENELQFIVYTGTGYPDNTITVYND